MGWMSDNSESPASWSICSSGIFNSSAAVLLPRATGKRCHSHSVAPYLGQLTRCLISANIAELKNCTMRRLDSVAWVEELPHPLENALPQRRGSWEF
jgi:hypothetical protein